MKKHLIRNAILMAVATLIMGVFLSLYIANTRHGSSCRQCGRLYRFFTGRTVTASLPTCCTALPVQQFFLLGDPMFIDIIPLQKNTPA